MCNNYSMRSVVKKAKANITLYQDHRKQTFSGQALGQDVGVFN